MAKILRAFIRAIQNMLKVRLYLHSYANNTAYARGNMRAQTRDPFDLV